MTEAQRARKNELARRRRAENPEHVRAKFRTYYDPVATRERKLRERYGIGIAHVEALIAEQGGCCALCSVALADILSRRVHVDHDHATGKVRGVLCVSCNTALGKLGDGEEGLLRALAYVRRSKERETP